VCGRRYWRMMVEGNLWLEMESSVLRNAKACLQNEIIPTCMMF
jgi:hypothetical protein